jgi:hypothetical protein
MTSAIPAYLIAAIHDRTADPDERAKLTAEWERVLREGEERAERIRALVKAHPRGFFRQRDEG